jgi:hypothetical protein
MRHYFLVASLLLSFVAPAHAELVGSSGATPAATVPVEVQVGGFVTQDANIRASGLHAGAGARVGRRLWVDVDALTFRSESQERRPDDSEHMTERADSTGIRMRWENSGGSIAVGARTFRYRRSRCWEIEEDAECGEYSENVPLPSLEWRVGRLDGFHHTGSILGGVRTNPNLALVRAGVGYPAGRVRLEAGVDSTSGGYVMADVPLGGHAILRTTAGTTGAGAITGGAQFLFSFK